MLGMTCESDDNDAYEYGTLVQSSVVFTVKSSGAAIDPDVVKVSVRSPDEEITTYTYPTDTEVIRSALGNFYIQIDASQAGSWYVRWFSTGVGQSAIEDTFEVKQAKAIE